METFWQAGLFRRRLLLGQADYASWGEVYRVRYEITGVPLDVWRLHPTQLYESFAMPFVFFFLLWLHKHRRFNGQVILFYALLYSVIRFCY